jgi:hypothetical protein
MECLGDGGDQLRRLTKTTPLVFDPRRQITPFDVL